MTRALQSLAAEIIECRRCPRLVAWREEVARVKRRAYREDHYWGRPVPGFGDPKAKLLIVGLAPGAHGANRTGRMFTGDKSGDFLYPALHRAGFANRPDSVWRDDGVKLKGAFITAPVRCVPPDNKPTPDELLTCRHWFERELSLLKPKVVLALGAIGWAAVLGHFDVERPRPAFAHGAEAPLPNGLRLLGSFHVSQQNTQTGRLTAAMFDRILKRARTLLDAL